MMEKTAIFGRAADLTGIVTLPVRHDSTLPAIVLLNAGFIHRIGPYRLNVDLARLLARDGFTSLRFDAHGLGDSAEYRADMPYVKQAVQDIGDALDFLEREYGFSACVLVGLCSGADQGHAVALVDRRVRGLALLDGYAYPTLGFYLRDYGPGLVTPARWANRIKKLLRHCTPSRAKEFLPPVAPDPQVPVYIRTFPPKKQILMELKTIIGRGVELCFIYSGGVPVYYNYRNQFQHMFRSLDFKGRMCYRFFPHADHTYTRTDQRTELVTELCSWIRLRFGKRPQ